MGGLAFKPQVSLSFRSLLIILSLVLRRQFWGQLVLSSDREFTLRVCWTPVPWEAPSLLLGSRALRRASLHWTVVATAGQALRLRKGTWSLLSPDGSSIVLWSQFFILSLGLSSIDSPGMTSLSTISDPKHIPEKISCHLRGMITGRCQRFFFPWERSSCS